MHADATTPTYRPRSNLARTSSVLAVSLLLFGGIAVLGSPPAQAASSGTTVETIMATTALSFVPATITISTLSVELEVENVGTVDHTFTLSSRVNQTAPDSTNTSSNAPGTFFASNEVLADQPLNQGQTIFLNITFASAGSYEFICRIHFPSMVGEINAGVPTSGGTSTPIYVYGAAVGIVVVIAAVVAVVAMRRRKPAAPAPSGPK